jgi:(R,R)-butanediol dehydrogenase/meso-butanediol dehydrogenase/diacetyl reductase
VRALQFNVSVPQWLTLKVLGRLNPALFYRGPLATVRLVDVAVPRLPGKRWVKLKTRCTGFCASDLNLIFLRDAPSASPFTSFPCIMGHEICATVVETGPDVRRATKGDRVAVCPALTCTPREMDPACPACVAGQPAACANTAEGRLAPGMFIGICRDTGGGFAPYFVAHESQLFKLPPILSDAAGALIEPLSVALQAVLNNPPQADEHVLVVGGGVIGSLIVQVIRSLAAGSTVTVADPSEFAAETCRKSGATHLVTGGDLFGAAVRIAGARRYKPIMGPPMLMGGFHRVFDTVGTSATLNTALRSMAASGTLSLVGIGHAVKLDTTPLWLKSQQVKGVYACGWSDYQGARRHMFEIGIDLAAKGKVDLERLATHRFALEDFAAAIQVNCAKARHKAIKTLFTFD